MSVVKEFRDFVMRGNVIDLAVGVVMGAAFAPIVGALVDNIVMPPIGYLMAGIDFSELSLKIPTAKEPVLIKYGLFLNAVVKFMITAAAIFLVVKAVNTMKKPVEAAPPAGPSASEVYLMEIRDILGKLK